MCKVYIFRVSFHKSISILLFSSLPLLLQTIFSVFFAETNNFTCVDSSPQFSDDKIKSISPYYFVTRWVNLEWKTQCDNSFVNVSIQLIMSLGFKIFFIFGYHILMLLHLLTFFFCWYKIIFWSHQTQLIRWIICNH